MEPEVLIHHRSSYHYRADLHKEITLLCRLPYIQIGSEVVVKEYPDRREYAVWEEVLNACLKEKYIERKGEAICVITNAGYKVVE